MKLHVWAHRAERIFPLRKGRELTRGPTLLAGAVKGDAVESLGLSDANCKAVMGSIERASMIGRRKEMYRGCLNRGREVGTPLMHGRELMAGVAGCKSRVYAQHHAVMRSVPAAARRKSAAGPARSEERRGQREADKQQERDGDDAAHD